MVKVVICLFAFVAVTLGQPHNLKTLLEYKDLNDAMLHIATNGDPTKIQEIKNLQNHALVTDDDDDLKDLVFFCLFNSSDGGETYEKIYLDDVASFTGSSYDPSLPLKVVTHGYINDINSDAVQAVKDSFMSLEKFNVIGVDWGLIAKTEFYNIAADQTQRVGNYVGKFLAFLNANGVSYKNVHLQGHSLGAHVCGFAGAHVKTNEGQTVARITGLDPAFPWFMTVGTDGRLDPSDADFVDCIHTCGGYLGFYDPICQVDFYPNGGTDVQPGCLPDLGICSHGRSVKYYAESIKPDHVFDAVECLSPPKSADGCVSSDVKMGFPAKPGTTGIYYVETNSKSPFAQN